MIYNFLKHIAGKNFQIIENPELNTSEKVYSKVQVQLLYGGVKLSYKKNDEFCETSFIENITSEGGCYKVNTKTSEIYLIRNQKIAV